MTPNDVKTVADNIDDFIEVPDGVARLRKAVLTLAVSGKLVPQDKKEGPAVELYERIQVEKAKTEASTHKRNKKESNLISDEVTPFDIPKSWKWVQLGEVCYIEMGQSPDGSDVVEEKIGLPFFQGKAEFGEISPTPKKWCTNPRKIAEKGDILISVRAPVGTTNMS